jgi:hypothetical protein
MRELPRGVLRDAWSAFGYPDHRIGKGGQLFSAAPIGSRHRHDVSGGDSEFGRPSGLEALDQSGHRAWFDRPIALSVRRVWRREEVRQRQLVTAGLLSHGFLP